MTNSQMKKQAKTKLKGKWGLAIGTLIVGFIIMSLLSSTLVGSLLAGLVTYGYASVFIAIIRNQNAKFEKLFDCINNFGPVIVASILKYVFLFLWSLLFCIPGLVKAYSYAMTEYILIDNPTLGGNDAITESRKMMNGHKMQLFLLDLSFIGWYLLSILTFGILLLYVDPYHNAARAEFYENLKASAEA